uniref:Uncharacterized protein n=1 Tax=Anguilla anguilla TaxID=7936 RepID=A0A0E9RWZ8_ANGAN
MIYQHVDRNKNGNSVPSRFPFVLSLTAELRSYYSALIVQHTEVCRC